MPRKKRIKKDERTERKKARLAAILEKQEKPLKGIEVESEDVVETAKELANSGNPIFYIKNNHKLEDDEYVFKAEKNSLQKELDKFKNPVILETPEFLLDADLSVERKMVMDKIKYLLKHRFSLVAIADIIETNDYSRLDEIIARKDNTFKAVEKYTSEESDKTLRLFAGFKKTVGEDYSKIYSEQEERVKAAINILYDGTYFESAEQEGEKVETYLEDIVANVIDNPDFNLACQIESEFIKSQMEHASSVLSELRSRQELDELLDELKTVSLNAEDRMHKYQVMDRLMTGKGRKIIPEEPEEGER